MTLYRCEDCGMVENNEFIKCPNCMSKESCVKMENTKEFKVGFYYIVYGNTIVSADSKDSAEEIVVDTLSWDGIDNLNYNEEDREYKSTYVEILNEEK